jgi:hypothetical protein
MLALFVTMLTLASCADGYYDHNGNYVSGQPTPEPHLLASTSMTPPQTQVRSVTTATYSPEGELDTTTTRTTVSGEGYTEAGLYDANGVYIAPEFGPNIPAAAAPPLGYCRVWFPDKPLPEEPAARPCEGIRNNMPVGAYVIYGG